MVLQFIRIYEYKTTIIYNLKYFRRWLLDIQSWYFYQIFEVAWKEIKEAIDILIYYQWLKHI